MTHAIFCQRATVQSVRQNRTLCLCYFSNIRTFTSQICGTGKTSSTCLHISVFSGFFSYVGIRGSETSSSKCVTCACGPGFLLFSVFACCDGNGGQKEYANISHKCENLWTLHRRRVYCINFLLKNTSFIYFYKKYTYIFKVFTGLRAVFVNYLSLSSGEIRSKYTLVAVVFVVMRSDGRRAPQWDITSHGRATVHTFQWFSVRFPACTYRWASVIDIWNDESFTIHQTCVSLIAVTDVVQSGLHVNLYPKNGRQITGSKSLRQRKSKISTMSSK